jgi:adenylosuccinate lyase
MVARLTDFGAYAHLWGTDEARAVFEERATYERWLAVLAALADAQAELGIIPAEAAAAIGREARADRLDLDRVAAETRRTGHSTLGLIRELAHVLPADAHPWVYYGATVQDLTDTATALAAREVLRLVWRDLRATEAALLDLAEAHRDTPMAGRTHGRIGSPITFGLKAASWADELRRGLHRVREVAPRVAAGQLAGSVGSLTFFPETGVALRARFCERLGLADPGISWTAARDRPAELVTVLELATAALARIGGEVYQLQRDEIGELHEPAGADAVGSITMPHKRNPEASEHLVTLHRLVAASAQVGRDALVGEHERDARTWKAEWVAVPEACLLACAAAHLGRGVVEGLEVDAGAMRRRLAATDGRAASERLLAALAPRLGKHTAQQRLQAVLAGASNGGDSLAEAVRADPELAAHVDDATLEAADAEAGTACAPAMVDWVVQRARRERADEPEEAP